MWTNRRKQPSLPSHDTQELSNWVPNIPPGDGFSEPAENAFIVLKWDHQEAKWKQLENGKAVEWGRIEEKHLLKMSLGTYPGVRWLRIHLAMQEMQVQSLVRELRFHMLQSNSAREPRLLSLHTLEPQLHDKRSHVTQVRPGAAE